MIAARPSHAHFTQFTRWAKAKRERLRAAHMAPDYMPLHGDGPGGLGSRLRDKKAAEEAIRPMESGSDEEPGAVMAGTAATCPCLLLFNIVSLSSSCLPPLLNYSASFLTDMHRGEHATAVYG